MAREKKGLLSRLFGTQSESDCCQVNIVNDDETPERATAERETCCSDTSVENENPDISRP